MIGLRAGLWNLVAIAFLACGCAVQHVAEESSRQLLDVITNKLGSFATAIDAAASAGPANQAELSDDLLHRVASLEDALGELHYRTRANAVTQASVQDLAATVAEMRRIIESSPRDITESDPVENLDSNPGRQLPNLVSLREQLQRLRVQIAELQPEL